MDKRDPKPISFWLFGANLVVFLILLALPATYWITAAQSKMLLVTPGEYALAMKDLGVKEATYDADAGPAEAARRVARCRGAAGPVAPGRGGPPLA